LKKVLIINGPNLNLLGKREPVLYGSESFNDFFQKLVAEYSSLALEYQQTNSEGELTEAIQNGEAYHAVIVNPGAYSHTSIAIADAAASIDTPVIEVHISNIFAREEVRHHSFLSPRARAVVAGAGLEGYRMALDLVVRL
jgi:3-dehydroquinate dehydratase-2